MKVTRAYRKMANIYKLFCDYPEADLSEKALEEAFIFESTGNGIVNNSIFGGKVNGYLLGKKWLNVTVAMWREDIKKGLFAVREFYNDKFPKWWLDKVFK